MKARWTVLVIGGLVAILSGCAPLSYWTGATGPPPPVYYGNPIFLPVSDHRQVWETIVDVIDDDFEIDREEPVRLVGSVYTEGQLETFPKVGATLLEPWLGDSVGRRERIESTLQSIRRRVEVRVQPDNGGYLVNITVLKELEDVVSPEYSTAGVATLRYDDTLNRIVNPVGEQEINRGWIPQGRDSMLEQRILGKLLQRVGGPTVWRMPPVR